MLNSMEGVGIKKLYLIVGLSIIVATALVYFIGLPRLAAYYREEGRKNIANEEFDQAVLNLEKSLRFNKTDPVTHALRGQAGLGKPVYGGERNYPDASDDNYREAIGYYEKSLSFGLEGADNNLYSFVLQDAGGLYRELKEYDKATEKFLTKIEKFPDRSFWPRYLVAIDYFDRSNKPQEALDILLPAPESNNVKIEALSRVYTLLAILYGYFDDNEESEKYAKLAIENSFDDKRWEIQSAHILTAYAAVTKGDIKSAEEEIKKANELYGSQNAHQCHLSQTYRINGDYQKAIETAKSVPNTQPAKTYSTCLKTLGESYLAEGDKTQAQKYYEAYLNLTEPLELKNIFIQRNIQEIQKALETL